MITRHIGPSKKETQQMLEELDSSSLDELIKKNLPKDILSSVEDKSSLSELDFLKYARYIGSKNTVWRNYIGQGYYPSFLPPVIQKNILSNPSWYTAYTPYQAEISQGRLEALFNFQTMVTELTGMDICNASLLDEATAAAEAISMAWNIARQKKHTAFIDKSIFSQSLAVVKTRSKALGIKLIIDDIKNFTQHDDDFFAVLVQNPNSKGEVNNLKNLKASFKDPKTALLLGVDLLSLNLLSSPLQWKADIVFGTTQRFGLALGFGGPHSAFISCKDQYKRQLPGRLIGLSKDKWGNPALRMALQTREQHIRREKATSNICTSQVLLAVLSSMYAVYHGPKGLKAIAQNIHTKTKQLASQLTQLNYVINNTYFFDTLNILVTPQEQQNIKTHLDKHQINFYFPSNTEIQISIDELITEKEMEEIFHIFSRESFTQKKGEKHAFDESHLPVSQKYQQILLNTSFETWNWSSDLQRTDLVLQQRVFNSYHSETQMMRYIKSLEKKDLALNHSMIPLGSCTMKLTSATSLEPLSWPQWSDIHPFAPLEQAKGYLQMIKELETMLCQLTGLDACSVQPNSGAQGEFAGLLTIAAYHKKNNNHQRNICLVPQSAHGTNPASANMAGMKVVIINCDQKGNIDVEDLKTKAQEHKSTLAALMITYPSTHGVFEESIIDICKIIHDNGGQIYLDGANMNALIGISKPALWPIDVCHLNLHKTFSIPHGGGGPGVGPILVRKHLQNFLPSHPVHNPNSYNEDLKDTHCVSAAPWGSASVLTISWAYLLMLGFKGIKQSTKIAILNANYMAKKLAKHFSILYTGKNNFVAHECIIDCRDFPEKYGASIEDIAKRLMDYGFHSPTMAWPVAGTLMIEPTESESKQEMDRFIQALSSIKKEMQDQPELVTNAPHTLSEITKDEWNYKYSRTQAAYPLPWVKDNKFWPSVGRIDQAYGDKNLICACPSVDSYT
ncbi:MAG: aminomethyl-transferring glycine dehydrogenase [Bdellovibrionaceae bacterium]|nr:aminomethyl-transferring glycine dehydrogenase [Pseudobdellovibrionaceae bacterium]